MGVCKRWLGVFLAMILVMGACRTTKREQPASVSRGDIPGTPSSVSGEFDANNRMLLSVPTGLNKPTTASSEATISPLKRGNTPSGLGLTSDNESRTLTKSRRPQTFDGAEGIEVACFSADPRFSNEQWFMYAELMKDDAFIEATEINLQNCGSIQAALYRLNKEDKYKVLASIFWRDQESKKEVVLYEGETKEFQPSDQAKELVLKQLKQDQKVNIAYEKSASEQCKEDGYFWNGYNCMNEPHLFSFIYTGKFEKGDDERGGIEKCMAVTENGAALSPCEFAEKNKFVFRFHGKGNVGSDSNPVRGAIDWYTIKLGSETSKKCLTSVKSGSEKLLQAIDCVSPGESAEFSAQLFSIAKASSDERMGSNAYRIISMHDTANSQGSRSDSRYCISVPPPENAPTSEVPFHDGADVKLERCSSRDRGTVATMYFHFINQDSFINVLNRG